MGTGYNHTKLMIQLSITMNYENIWIQTLVSATIKTSKLNCAEHFCQKYQYS